MHRFPAEKLVSPREEHPWAVDGAAAVAEPPGAEDRGIVAQTSEGLSRYPEARENECKRNCLMEDGEGLAHI